MTDEQMLAGSLSNDLFRVAALAQRGSTQAASRFLAEAKRWALDLQTKPVAGYIKKIAEDISSRHDTDILESSAERYLISLPV